MFLRGIICSKPSESPSPQPSVTSYMPNSASLPCFLIPSFSLTWTVFSKEYFPWRLRHSSSPTPPQSFGGSFPFCFAFQMVVLPQGSVLHPFLFPVCMFLPLYLQQEDMEIKHQAWESKTWRCVWDIREELPVEALLRAARSTGSPWLPSLLITPVTGLKNVSVAHGGNWEVVEPERVLQLLSVEERGGTSWTCFDAQGHK